MSTFYNLLVRLLRALLRRLRRVVQMVGVPLAPVLDRRAKLLHGIDPRQSVGAEIGSLDRPVVLKSEGHVVYVDHCDTQALKQKYASNPTVSTDKLHVDAVWGEDTLIEAIKKYRQRLDKQEAEQGLDYVIASHVIEHVPDMITWLEEIHEALKPTGQLCLAIPDKRYSFDYLRSPSTLASLISAYVRKDRIPNTHCILDFMLNMATVDCAAAWRGKIDPTQLKPEATFDGALAVARDALHNQAYHDVHCWVFTPSVFAQLCAGLAKNNLLKFECVSFFDTAHYQLEFFVTMKPSNDQNRIAASWLRMAEACK
jgi:SAM-dependent methyltransferase